MRTLSRAVVALGLLLGSGVSAIADIQWTLNDVTFNNGNVAAGYFTTNDAVTKIDSFSIEIIGPASGGDFTAAIMADAYLPKTIGIASLGWVKYVDLYLASPLTNAGGTVHIASGFDCPGCGTLIVRSDTGVTGVPLPEPSALASLGAFAAVLAAAALRRRKRLR